MRGAARALSDGRTRRGRGGTRTAQPALLASGVVAPLVYLAGDLIAARRRAGYSIRDQTISELNAIGAPTRRLTIVLGLAGYTLLTVFGVGALRLARPAPGGSGLRVAGGALVAYGVKALWAVPFASMHVRGVARSRSDTLHLVDGATAGLLLAVAIGSAAAAFGTVYRLYSAATVLVSVAFAAWTAMDGRRIAEDLPTPWAGVKERISVYAYQLWIVVLAARLLRRHLRAR